MVDLLKNKKVILSIFVVSAIFDLLGVIYALISKNILLLSLFVIIAPTLIVGLIWYWNVDERTELALMNASRDTVTVYLVLIFTSGVGFLVYAVINDFKYWMTTATLIIGGFVLLFIQAIMSVVYELRMQ